MVETLGFERFAFIPWTLYTTPNEDGMRVFDPEKLAGNAGQIIAICQGAEWAITNMEGRQRYVITHPNNPNLKPGELPWAVKQYMSSWSAVRAIVPDIKLMEWAWADASDARFWLMDHLAVHHLDGFAPSTYWNPNDGRMELIADRMAHAIELGNKHNKPVFSWINGWYKVWNEGRTVATYHEIGHQNLLAILEVAKLADHVVYWSNTLQLIEVNNPAKIVAMTQRPGFEIEDVYAWHAVVLGEARRVSK